MLDSASLARKTNTPPIVNNTVIFLDTLSLEKSKASQPEKPKNQLPKQLIINFANIPDNINNYKNLSPRFYKHTTQGNSNSSPMKKSVTEKKPSTSPPNGIAPTQNVVNLNIVLRDELKSNSQSQDPSSPPSPKKLTSNYESSPHRSKSTKISPPRKPPLLPRLNLKSAPLIQASHFRFLNEKDELNQNIGFQKPFKKKKFVGYISPRSRELIDIYDQQHQQLESLNNPRSLTLSYEVQKIEKQVYSETHEKILLQQKQQEERKQKYSQSAPSPVNSIVLDTIINVDDESDTDSKYSKENSSKINSPTGLTRKSVPLLVKVFDEQNLKYTDSSRADSPKSRDASPQLSRSNTSSPSPSSRKSSPQKMKKVQFQLNQQKLSVLKAEVTKNSITEQDDSVDNLQDILGNNALETQLFIPNFQSMHPLSEVKECLQIPPELTNFLLHHNSQYLLYSKKMTEAEDGNSGAEHNNQLNRKLILDENVDVKQLTITHYPNPSNVQYLQHLETKNRTKNYGKYYLRPEEYHKTELIPSAQKTREKQDTASMYFVNKEREEMKLRAKLLAAAATMIPSSEINKEHLSADAELAELLGKASQNLKKLHELSTIEQFKDHLIKVDKVTPEWLKHVGANNSFQKSSFSNTEALEPTVLNTYRNFQRYNATTPSL